MMGGALGGLEAMVLPHQGPGFWSLVSMGAILGGTMRSPFTGIIFALELTHDVNALLPLLIAVPCAYAFTVLTMRRSILTEKISRRGYHLSREYAVDPLELLFVREVMRTGLAVLAPDVRVSELAPSLRKDHRARGQRLYPVVEDADRLVGVITSAQLQDASDQEQTGEEPDRKMREIMSADLVTAAPDEPLRAVMTRMVE